MIATNDTYQGTATTFPEPEAWEWADVNWIEHRHDPEKEIEHYENWQQFLQSIFSFRLVFVDIAPQVKAIKMLFYRGIPPINRGRHWDRKLRTK